ncbi:MAG TPA: LysR family transcriptional regulator [Tissierellales bacterium]|nr:LysR family transcriptional regulator [Tissierellales bacterium]
MDLNYLKSFYMTVKCNSISRAAKKLHLTQPGLSIQIQNLENEVGATLLERSNKGVELTEEGQIVFEHANTMLSLEKNIIKNLEDLQNEKKKLSICACKSLGEYVIPCSIYTFREIYVDVNVFLEVYNTNTVIKKLLSHDTNIAIITGEHDFENIETVPILEDEFLLIAGPDVEEESITLDEITDIPLILREKGSYNKVLLSKTLLEHSINIDDLNIVLSVNSSESIKSSVSSGRGYAFLPKIVVKRELRRGTLKEIKIQDFEAKFSYYLAYRKNYKFTKCEEYFKKFITSNKRCFCY